MVVSQDTLKELFYYIMSNVNEKFLPDQASNMLAEANFERYYPKYFVDAMIQEGWLAGFFEKQGNEYKLTVRGRARSDMVSPIDLKLFTKMLMEAW